MKLTRLRISIITFGVFLILASSIIPTSAATDIVAQWEQIEVTVQPKKSVNMVLVYDPVNDVVITYGGSDGTYTSETMVYNPDTQKWTDLQPANRPVANYGYNMVYNPLDGNIILFGGLFNDPNMNYQNEVWAFNYTANTWTELTTTNAPSVRSHVQMIFDPVNEKILVFGGETLGFVEVNDLWEFDPVTNVWTELSPAGTLPEARTAASFVFDKRTNTALLVSGYDRSENVMLEDAHGYDYSSNTWTEIDLGLSLRFDNYGINWNAVGLFYDEIENTLVSFGKGDSHLLMVKLDNSTGTPIWDTIHAANIPTNRVGLGQITYMTDHDIYLFYGGYSGSVYHKDTYELSLAGGNRADPTFTIPVTVTPTPTNAATSTTEESFYPLIGLVALIPLVLRKKKSF